MYSSRCSIRTISKIGKKRVIPQGEPNIRSDCYIVTVKLFSLQLATRYLGKTSQMIVLPLSKNIQVTKF